MTIQSCLPSRVLRMNQIPYNFATAPVGRLCLRVLLVLATLFFARGWRSLHAQTACPNPYIVQPGDNLNRIAQRCGVTLTALRAANPQIPDPRRIEVGDTIYFPGDASISAATQQALANATYQLTASDNGVISLRNGFAQRQTGDGLLTVELVGPLAEGDVNHDGWLDAAAILKEQLENTTGRFYSLHLLLGNGGTLQEAAALFLEDRIRVNTLHIQPNGAIVLDMFTKGPNDPLAGASLHVRQNYQLQDGQLLLVEQIPLGNNGAGTTPATTVCANSYPTRLQKNSRAHVLPTPPKPNRVRNMPGKQATIVGEIQPGEAMSLLDGPRCGDGWVWWYVRADSGLVGWTSEGQVGEYWLAPGEVTGGGVTSNPSASFLGVWYTNFAEMSLDQVGNSVTGSYVRYSRSAPTILSGTVADQTLTGKNENNTSFRLTLSPDGQSFSGVWVGRDGRNYPWCGVRSGPLPTGCGFSGRWQTNHGGGVGWVQVQQVGSEISGRYFNGATEGDLTGNFELWGTQQEYTLSGVYNGDNGDRGLIRLRLVDLSSDQFQGCWLDQQSGGTGSWCGWRAGGGRPAQCLLVPMCP